MQTNERIPSRSRGKVNSSDKANRKKVIIIRRNERLRPREKGILSAAFIFIRFFFLSFEIAVFVVFIGDGGAVVAAAIFFVCSIYIFFSSSQASLAFRCVFICIELIMINKNAKPCYIRFALP